PLFSADGKQLLVGFRDSSRSPRDPAVRVQVWDCGTNKLLTQSAGGMGHLFFQDTRPLALLDGETLALQDVSRDQMLEVHPLLSPSPCKNYQLFAKFAFSSDGRLCVEAGLAGQLAVWEIAGPKRTLRAVIPRRRPASFDGQDLRAVSRDGWKTAAFDGRDHLAVWDTRWGKEMGRLKLEGRPELFVFAPGDQELWLVYLGRQARSWRFGETETRVLCRLETDDRLE